MTTLQITHDSFLGHDTGEWHPERSERMIAIERALSHPNFQDLITVEAPQATLDQIARAHPRAYVDMIESKQPKDESVSLDEGDTIVSPGSWEATLRAAGAGIYAVDEVMQGKANNAFCRVRPPGHHAEIAKAMGFCLFNNAAVAAFHAKAVHGAERVAVVDFDLHHGNGTQSIFWNQPSMMYASTHQMPLFPGTGGITERGDYDNIINAPLRAGDGSSEFREAFELVVLPELRKYSPDLLIISAGFDGHRADPLGNLNLVDEDFNWVTRKLIDVARERCDGRVVSLLEGGYDLVALGRCAAVHVQALLESY